MSYKFDSLVNNQEQSALREMIFNRVKERSQNLSEDIQTDVMEIARESFVSKNNPFSQILENKNTDTNNQLKIEESKNKTEKVSDNVISEIGFEQRKYAPRAISQNNNINNQISASTIYNNMKEARDELANKKGFMGALEFLNSQAAISLARVHRTDRFEMVV